MIAFSPHYLCILSKKFISKYIENKQKEYHIYRFVMIEILEFLLNLGILIHCLFELIDISHCVISCSKSLTNMGS